MNTPSPDRSVDVDEFKAVDELIVWREGAMVLVSVVGSSEESVTKEVVALDVTVIAAEDSLGPVSSERVMVGRT